MENYIAYYEVWLIYTYQACRFMADKKWALDYDKILAAEPFVANVLLHFCYETSCCIDV